MPAPAPREGVHGRAVDGAGEAFSGTGPPALDLRSSAVPPQPPTSPPATASLSDRSAETDGTVGLVVAFIVLTVLTLVASNVWLAWRSYGKEIALAQESTRNIAHAVSQQFDSLFSDVDRALETITFQIERGDLSRTSIEELQPMLVNILSRSDHLHSLFVFDREGLSVINTQPTRPSTLRNNDRPYFVAHLASPSTQTLIGAPLAGRSTGTHVIPVSRRINDFDGQFAGVVLASVRIDYVLGMLQGFEVGDEGAIALTLNNGAILTRRPFSAADLHRSLADSPIFTVQRTARAGTLRMNSPIDGVRRLVGFEHTKNHPLVVAVARAEREIFESWWHALAVQTATVVLMAVLIGLSGRYLVVVIRQRRDAQGELRAAHQDLLAANERLWHLAEHDGLTGVLNRRAFDARGASIAAHCARYRRGVSLVLFDVDHFKAYNDHFGHQSGDDCLRAVARALAGAARRPGDVVARYGGEEFVVVLPETDEAGAAAMAENALQAVRALRISHPQSPLEIVTVSAGGATVVCGPETSAAIDVLLQQADRALYTAKHDGRNAYRAFTDPTFPV
ncbi:diguanylate cyclase (GGDEF)-like protein [Paracidovorax wautersii]|uniref:diguanylate cyclase n=1 Tax=Paracidovorax wautersii TaxID=1177982 RepID=A0ABU1IE87_9BURK|nr:diguanylate cyclase (GGDEF)-like protein [Paracidovorax wautersii]